MRGLIKRARHRLRPLCPEITGDPKKSMFRIYPGHPGPANGSGREVSIELLNLLENA
jgi:hypothetical protein